MTRLYNIRFKRGLSQKRAINLSVFSLIVAVCSLGICCRKSATTTNQAPMRPSAEAIAEADRLYEGRADLMKVRQAIVALRQAQADDPTNYDIAWRLAEFDYFLGSHSSDSGEKDKAFREGIEAGKLAVKLQDGKPEGHFWLGANYGGSAEMSTLAGLSEVEDIKREMETVIKLNEKYQDASAYLLLGQVYLDSPTLLGGDTQKAISYLDKALRQGHDT